MTKEPQPGRGTGVPLTTVDRHVDAPPERVFAALSDGWLLPVWVVGATHIRDVDENWPEPGSRAHHQVGPWPVSIADSTAVVDCEPPRRLVLQARAYPVGEARVDITVEPDGTGSRVVMAEAPTHGAARLLDNPLQRWVLAARNRESLARLAALAEHRRELSMRAPTPGHVSG
jgi:uncharacterized protein YndB with AHSA1/START domain